MKNLTLGRYRPGNSLFHRLDPRTKLAAMIAIMVVIFLPNLTLESYLILTFLLVFSAVVSGTRIRSLLKSLKVMWLMFVFLFIINIFIRTDGLVLVNINGFVIHWQALIMTLEIVLRMFLMITLSTILTVTTKPMDLTFALEWYLHPTKIVRFPVHEVALIISLALRFIPTILEDAQRIIKAQASRGVDYQGAKLHKKIANIISLIIPLFISAFERSEDLALAMDARGYDSRAKRTRFRQFHLRLRDYCLFLVTAGLVTFFIIFNRYQLIPIDEIVKWVGLG